MQMERTVSRSAILRSLQTGEPAHILGRKTLGAADAPTIELLLDGGQARFDGTAWSAIKSEIGTCQRL